MQECHFLAQAESARDDDRLELCWVGVPSEPEEFVRRAIEAGHPRGLDVHVVESMKRVINLNLVEPPFVLAKQRVDFSETLDGQSKGAE